MMRGSDAQNAIFIAALLSLVGACATPPPGTLMHRPTNPQLSPRPQYRLAVAQPVDARPAVEREGGAPKTTLFVPALLVWIHQSRGNWISNERLSSRRAVTELQQMSARYLRRAGVFADVTLGSKGADFVLTSKIKHLYGTAYEARNVWVVIHGSRSGGADTHTARDTSAVYGNAIIDYALYDQRGGRRRLVWKRTVRGTAASAASKRPHFDLGPAAHAATRRALASLAFHVTTAVKDYTFDEAALAKVRERLAQADKQGSLRFVVQRTSQQRTATEFLTIAYATGAIVKHKILGNEVLPIGEPSEWMLSRWRPNHTLMPYGEYQALANLVARDFDLRRVDEMYHYHFFGRRKQSSAAAEGPASEM